ncbi:hypothetical protein OIV83_000429 [Microbotryomycetes sp. JL201]|nr:hypothetical protein OIV83_000429 [Microbotryomycetes sp. JL201]
MATDFQVLQRYKKAWNLDIVLKPVYLGGVMISSGNKPPITVANKGLWMNKIDMPLQSKFWQIPIKFPDSFPVQTMHVVRLLRVIADEAPEKLLAVTECFYEQIWTPKSKGATAAAKPENFRSVIPSSLVSDDKLKQWIEKSQADENKNRIKEESKQLVEQSGAFGMPWMEVVNDRGEETRFFGADRFEIMAFFLGKKWNGPFPANDSAKL